VDGELERYNADSVGGMACQRCSARCAFLERDENQGPFQGIVSGMATTRITITLPDDQIHSIRELVAGGKAGSVSAFVKHAVGVALCEAAGWREMLNDALQQTGGPLTKEERKWADALVHPKRKKGAGSRGMGKNTAA
jgi:Arc/MetJ-type ribon-helix-helix transcriptional regulator